MNIYNLIEENSTTVKGPEGKDNIPANVPAGSFVVPVQVTPGEKIIPPENIPVVDNAMKKAGANGIQDLAPKSKNIIATVPILDKKGNPTGQFQKKLVPRGKDVQDNKGFTESQLRDKAPIKQESLGTGPVSAEFKPNGEIAINNGYETGGYVNAQGILVDKFGKPIYQQTAETALGVSNQDISEMGKPKAQTGFVNPIQQMPEPNTDQMLADVPQIPINDGSQEIADNVKKVQDLLGLSTPKFDEKKAERLKKIAAFNSVGQALSTAFGGYIGAKGGPILNTANDITPKALAEYTTMLENDKQNKYRTNIMQVQEAIKGMHDIAVNELNNKRTNQKMLYDAQQAINKFKLDKYADNEKYRRDIDAKLFQYGIDVAKIAQKQGYDEEKTKAAVENQWKLARYNQSQQNYRAKLSADGKGNSTNAPVTFSINGIEDELTENDVIALANVALTDRVAKAGKYADELKDDPDYQYIFRASSGGLNAKELKQFVQKYYPIYRDKAGVVSKNDIGKMRQPQYITPQGQMVNVGGTQPQVPVVTEEEDPDADLLVQ